MPQRGMRIVCDMHRKRSVEMGDLIRELFDNGEYHQVVETLDANALFDANDRGETQFFYCFSNAQVAREANDLRAARQWVDKALNLKPNDAATLQLQEMIQPPLPDRIPYESPQNTIPPHYDPDELPRIEDPPYPHQ